MNKYILREYLEQLLDHYLTNSNGAEHYAYNIIKGEIEHAPAADVVEVKHGYWIDHYTNIVCSECGAEYSDEIIFMNRDFNYSELHYCPNCGAQMNMEG